MSTNKKLKVYDPDHERKTYDKDFYERHAAYYDRAIPHFTNYMKENFVFESMCDLGCGPGDFLRELQNERDVLGVDFSVGVPQTLAIDPSKYVDADLTKPLPFNRHFDVVMSLEVWEHLHPEFEKQYLDNVDSLTPDHVIISCAAPKQWGRHHYSPHEAQYVLDAMISRGYVFDEELTAKFKKIKLLASFYRRNTFVFHKAK